MIVCCFLSTSLDSFFLNLKQIPHHKKGCQYLNQVLREKSPAVDLPLPLGFSITSFPKAQNEDAQKIKAYPSLCYDQHYPKTQSHSKETYLNEMVGQAHHNWKRT